tara:strand:- start:2009 stop:2200 length:192 start_codon:yes stop_codon:yes gene_type:complete
MELGTHFFVVLPLPLFLLIAVFLIKFQKQSIFRAFPLVATLECSFAKRKSRKKDAIFFQKYLN